MKTWYVMVLSKWVEGRWMREIECSQRVPNGLDPSLRRVFEVQSFSHQEAVADLVEWQARGRPADMLVKEVA